MFNSVVLCYVFSEAEKFGTKVIENNKGDFFDLTTINQADYLFLPEWLFIANPSLGRHIPSGPLLFAQAWPCLLSRHLIAMHWDNDARALMLQAPWAWKGGPYGARMEAFTK